MKNIDKHPKTGIFRVRVTYPDHLRTILRARSFTKSLGTRSAREAQTNALPILADLQKQIDAAQAAYNSQQAGQPPVVTLTPQEGLSLIQQWRDAYLIRAANVLATGEGSAANYLAVGQTPAEDQKILTANPTLMIAYYYSDEALPLDVLNRTLDRILEPHGHILPPTGPLRVALRDSLRATINNIKTTENGWKNDTPLTLTNLPPAAPVPTPVALSPPVAPSPSGPTSRQLRLEELWERYTNRNGANERTSAEQKAALGQLEAILGRTNPWAHEITFDEAEKFYETVKWLPKSMTEADRQIPLTKLAEDMRAGIMKRPKVAGATAAKKLQLISAMFSWAEARQHLRNGNPFARLAGPKDTKSETTRKPFTSQHINDMFKSPFYTGCKSYTDWREAGSVLITNHRFWLPLMALATGARLNELGQLLVSDVKSDNDILYFDITEQTDPKDKALTGTKSLKTHSSTRQIPLHDVLVKAGFEHYWRWLLTCGQKTLFPELPVGITRTKDMSRWFGRAFKTSVGINDPSYTFHSFRHFFKDRCREATLPPDLHNTLSGHARSSVADGYGQGLSLATLKAGMDQITFPGLPEIPLRSGPFAMDTKIGVVMADKQ